MKTEPLEALFDYLSSDRNQAGERYEALRRVLMKFFEWRGALSPDHLTDLTFDRIAKKLVEGEQIRNINSYCQKVAFLIFLEWVNRQPDRLHEPLNDDDKLPPVMPFSNEESAQERRWECQRRCLEEMPPDNRAVIREYFAGEGRDRINHREEMAVRLAITRTALGNRIARLLTKLRECEQRCLKKIHD